MSWPMIAFAWVALSIPVLAFMKVASVPEEMIPQPNSIPDAEFKRLYLFAKQETFIDALAGRIALFPETEGRAYALEHLAIERAENLSRLYAFEAAA